ncbi:MAG: glycosyltransferase [Micrococcales bacterium]|nr:glycosyltransferase [Micrococcales bacterium]
MTPPVRISVLMPVYNPPASALRTAIDSVVKQRADFELIMVDDASTSAAVHEILSDAERDPRVRVVRRETNGGIVAASNDALGEATGEFVALFDHDDLLASGCLETVEEALDTYPDIDYLYTDEDKVTQKGKHFDVFAKPEWSPELLRGFMYTGHLSVLRTSLVREVGGFDDRAEGSQDHDLVLKVTERARRIVHIPQVLYHWRAVPGSAAMDPDAKPYAHDAGVEAVQRHLDRLGIAATVQPRTRMHSYTVVRELDPSVLVSIVIPTCGSTGLVWGERRCMVVELVRSILRHSTHRNLEIVVVYDRPTPRSVLDDLVRLGGSQVRLVLFDEPFNFSAKCNVGMVAASSDSLLFLNDDMEIVSEDFVVQLVAPLAEEGVGATGGRLLYADGTVQHAGHIYAQGSWTHAALKAEADDPGPFCAFELSRECSGLTAACLATTRQVMEQVGGFCEELPSNFNDVDLSYKILSEGYRMVWISGTTLYHFESVTRDPEVKQWEIDLVFNRWGKPDVDPYYPAGIVERRIRTRIGNGLVLLQTGGLRAVLRKIASLRRR